MVCTGSRVPEVGGPHKSRAASRRRAKASGEAPQGAAPAIPLHFGAIGLGGRVTSRFIVCDGSSSARLWGQIGAGEDEILSWVPQPEESRAGQGLQLALGRSYAERHEARREADDEFAFVTEDAAFAARRAGRRCVGGRARRRARPVRLGRTATLPSHPCLRATGCAADPGRRRRTSSRCSAICAGSGDPIATQRREKDGYSATTHPGPGGIAGARIARGARRRRPTATLISFVRSGTQNIAMVPRSVSRSDRDAGAARRFRRAGA